MAEKTIDKRFNNLLSKTKLKGVFKKVDNLEECDIVIIFLDNSPHRNIFVPKKDFKEKILAQLNEGNYELRYLKHTNPRYNNNKKLSKRLFDGCYSF